MTLDAAALNVALRENPDVQRAVARLGKALSAVTVALTGEVTVERRALAVGVVAGMLREVMPCKSTESPSPCSRRVSSSESSAGT